MSLEASKDTPAEFPDKAPTTPDGNQLRGLGGWLILIGLGHVIALVWILFGFNRILFLKNHTRYYELIPAALYSDVILFSAVFALIAYSTYLFFNRRRLFRRYFAIQCVFGFVFLPLHFIFMSVLFSYSTGMSWESVAHAIAPVYSMTDWIIAMVSVTVSGLYMNMSTRVENTFVE
jgi:hypothetical protein